MSIIPAQHEASQKRLMNDDYLLPTYFDIRDDILNEIEELKGKYEYFTITNKDIAEVREGTGNEMNIGDAVSLCILNEWKDYGGLSIDDGGDYKSDVGEGDKKVIHTSLYDEKNETIYYFLK